MSALMRPISRWVLCVGAIAAIAIYCADVTISHAASGKVVERAVDINGQAMVLLLGTAPQVRGQPNLFYVARIRAVLQLWRQGKIDSVLISGDNSRADYNEPAQMKADLVKGGIPPARMTCDYAGRRTLDSVMRARQVFGFDRVVIVSQREHVERALYLAQAIGLEAQGFAAEDAPRWWQVRQRLREMLARVRALVDVTMY